MTKIKRVNGLLIVALMVAVGVLILPAVSYAQTTNGNQAGCQAKVEDDNDADDTNKKANQSKYAREAKLTIIEARAVAL